MPGALRIDGVVEAQIRVGERVAYGIYPREHLACGAQQGLYLPGAHMRALAEEVFQPMPVDRESGRLHGPRQKALLTERDELRLDKGRRFCETALRPRRPAFHGAGLRVAGIYGAAHDRVENQFSQAIAQPVPKVQRRRRESRTFGQAAVEFIQLRKLL